MASGNVADQCTAANVRNGSKADFERHYLYIKIATGEIRFGQWLDAAFRSYVVAGSSMGTAVLIFRGRTTTLVSDITTKGSGTRCS